MLIPRIVGVPWIKGLRVYLLQTMTLPILLQSNATGEAIWFRAKGRMLIRMATFKREMSECEISDGVSRAANKADAESRWCESEVSSLKSRITKGKKTRNRSLGGGLDQQHCHKGSSVIRSWLISERVDCCSTQVDLCVRDPDSRDI